MGELNQVKWCGVRPTDPEESIPVKCATAADLKVEAAIAAAQTVAVTQATPANLKAEVEIATAQEIYNTPVRPTGSTQIVSSTEIQNTTADLLQVTAGKTLHITDIFCDVSNESGGAGTVSIYVTDASAVFQFRLINMRLADGLSKVISNTYGVTLEVAATYRVKITSGAANLIVSGVLHGYEI